MMKSRLSGRQLKKTVFELLQQPDFDSGIQQICLLPYRQVVNPLFSFLYSLDETIKWRTVSAMGAVISRLAEEEMESARIVMRRFIWNLNDESGGIGWGSPEAMGETMALSKKLADEYATILVSYIRPDGNYLEHEDLQTGVLWGIGRLAHARPTHVADAAPFLCAYMESAKPALRGLAAWAAAALPTNLTDTGLRPLQYDTEVVQIYRDGLLEAVRICDLVSVASGTA
jgi:hypothetical protein